MRTIETKLFQFSELSEKAKEKAIDNLFDINIFDDWWRSVYEDAKNVRLKIVSFDDDHCGIAFIEEANDTAATIINEHGEECETYKTAKTYFADFDKLVAKYSDGKHLDRILDENQYEFDKEVENLENDFLQSLSEDYRILLTKEYEYLTSKDAIIETIEANEYEFTEEGNRY